MIMLRYDDYDYFRDCANGNATKLTVKEKKLKSKNESLAKDYQS